MKIGQGLPVFDEADRALFSLEDPRRRADSLRDLLVPKIKAIHLKALGRLREVYRCDPLDGSSRKPSISPDHRKNALATSDAYAACVGLVGEKVGGKYFKPKLTYVLSSEGLRTLFWVNKEREASILDRVLRRHKGPIRLLLGSVDRPSVWAGGEGMDFADSEPLRGLPEADIAALDQFWHLGICGGLHEYPIDVEGIVERLLADYVALFPLYKSVVDVLHGEEDRFVALFERYEEWHRGRREGLILAEGEVSWSYRQHRRREKRLRKAKIREALARGGGRLRCEVPGCGFDFFEVYGEIGREFAHVHHLEPLGGQDETTSTSLADLAIVCANCHAMIHRGKSSRPLQGLIRQVV